MNNCVDDCLPYLRISRELLSVILAKPTPRNRKDRVYALMQLRANYRDGVMMCQGVVFDCLRGQLISTREEIARQLGVDRSAVGKDIALLEAEHKIVCRRLEYSVTCFTVVEYDTLQQGKPRRWMKPVSGGGEPEEELDRPAVRFYDRAERRPDDE